MECGTEEAANLSAEGAKAVLDTLRDDSATGPDRLPMKRCSASLALPVYLLGVAIVSKVKWPDNWGVHWIVAIYKKKAVFDPKNYRGVHLTAQLAKVLDIFLQPVFGPAFMAEPSIGRNQFAYSKGRGARDALAFLVLSWLTAFREKAKVALYMSDVSAAFDRVFVDRLVAKLAARGAPPEV